MFVNLYIDSFLHLFIYILMNLKYREMLQQSLTERTRAFQEVRHIQPPPKGWLQAVRTALGIPLRFVATRLQVTPSAVMALEQREVTGAITLKSLTKAADAIGCDVVYAIVPRAGSFNELLKQRAHFKAADLVQRVGHSMSLEQQATGNLKKRLADVATELAANPRQMWTDP
jgi:predicted DNA-binding mobile mystery protein A